MIASHPRHSMVNCVLLSLFYRQHNGGLGTLSNEGIEFGSENDRMVLHCLPVTPKQAKELP